MIRRQYSRGLGEIQIDLARPPTECPGGESRHAVARLLNDLQAMEDAVGQHDSRRVTARAHDDCRPLLAYQLANTSPCPRGAGDRPPIVPHSGAVERMQIEQEMRKLGLW